MMSRQVLHCAEVIIDIKIAFPIISRSERKSMNVSRDKCHCPETLMDTDKGGGVTSTHSAALNANERQELLELGV